MKIRAFGRFVPRPRNILGYGFFQACPPALLARNILDSVMFHAIAVIVIRQGDMEDLQEWKQTDPDDLVEGQSNKQ